MRSKGHMEGEKRRKRTRKKLEEERGKTVKGGEGEEETTNFNI